MGSTVFMSFLVFIVVAGFLLVLVQPVLAQYMDAYVVRIRPRKDKDDQVSISAKPQDSAILVLLRTVGDLVLSLMPALSDKRTLQLLREANYRTQAHLSIFIGVKSVSFLGCLFLGLISGTANTFGPIGIVIILLAAALGWLMPNFFLATRAKKRQAEILRELPTIIDLLIVCAQAGLGLLMAIDKVSKESLDSCPTLGSEMQQLINDVKVFSKSVPLAFRDMGERCGVDELISLASALVAAESKGADISYPLKQQGDALRDRLKRKKEEEAAKVPVKMVPVIMVFVMPLILAPMLGPAFMTIMQSFGTMTSGK